MALSSSPAMRRHPPRPPTRPSSRLHCHNATLIRTGNWRLGWRPAGAGAVDEHLCSCRGKHRRRSFILVVAQEQMLLQLLELRRGLLGRASGTGNGRGAACGWRRAGAGAGARRWGGDRGVLAAWARPRGKPASGASRRSEQAGRRRRSRCERGAGRMLGCWIGCWAGVGCNFGFLFF